MCLSKRNLHDWLKMHWLQSSKFLGRSKESMSFLSLNFWIWLLSKKMRLPFDKTIQIVIPQSMYHLLSPKVLEWVEIRMFNVPANLHFQQIQGCLCLSIGNSILVKWKMHFLRLSKFLGLWEYKMSKLPKDICLQQRSQKMRMSRQFTV